MDTKDPWEFDNTGKHSIKGEIINVSSPLLTNKELGIEKTNKPEWIPIMEDTITKGFENEEKQQKLKEAVEVLCKALREDEDYYRSFQANIAMAFQDECNREVKTGRQWWMDKDCHRISNQAAKNFLNLLIKE